MRILTKFSRTKKRKVLCCLMTLLVAIGINGCANNSASNVDRVDKKTYVSMTVTRSAGEEEFVSDVIELDVSDNSAQTIATVPYTSQYPLTCYSPSDNMIYYTACADDDHGDEVFCYDCKSGKSTQLTDDFFAINYLFRVEDGLFIAAVRRGDHTCVQPFLYHISDEKLEALSWDDDFYVNCAGNDQSNIFIAGYSEKKANEVFDDGDIPGIDNYIYKYDISNMKKTKIIEKPNCYIDDVVAKDNRLFYRSKDKIFNSKHTNYIYDLQTGKEEEIDIADKEGIDSVVGLYNAEVYYIVKEYQGVDSLSKLKKVNLDTGETTTLYETKLKECINNAQIVFAGE